MSGELLVTAFQLFAALAVLVAVLAVITLNRGGWRG